MDISFYSKIFEGMTENLIVVNMDMEILHTNKKGNQLLLKEEQRRQSGKILGQSIEEYFELGLDDKKRYATIKDFIRTHITAIDDNVVVVNSITNKNRIYKLFFTISSNDSNSLCCLRLTDIIDQLSLERTLKYKEKLLDDILKSSKDAVIAFDETGQIELFSLASEKIFGYNSMQMLLEKIYFLFSDSDREIIFSSLENLKNSSDIENIICLEKITGVINSGQTFPATILVTKTTCNSRTLFIMSVTDITSYNNFINSVNDAYIRTNIDGDILDWNSKAEKLFGWTHDEALNKNILDLKVVLSNNNKRNHEVVDVKKLLTRDDTADNRQLHDYYATRKDGSEITVNITMWPQQNDFGIEQYNILVKDITMKKISEERLRYTAYFDNLTKLANRSYFLKVLNTKVKKCKKTDEQFSLLFLDLDKFKWVNDTLGHDAGDLLLISVARRLRNCVRNEDMVSRLGGDEFTVLLSDNEAKEYSKIISERILKSLRNSFVINEKKIKVTVSIGITFFPENGDDVETLMKASDIAMYHAKDMGRDNYQVYTNQLHYKTTRRIIIENHLKNSIVNGEFYLLFQPKVDTRKGEVIGFESLIRWNCQEKDISPVDFIPISEETGFIIDISRWVFNAAIAQLAQWQKQGEAHGKKLTVSINISVYHFKYDMAKDLFDALNKYKVDPCQIELEITETALMENIDQCSAILKDISDRGVKISIDDFGTGYSSLRYLVDLHIDTLKIDRDFIRDIVTDKKSRHIVSAIIAMAKSLNLEIVVEGVETKEQLLLVEELGCFVFQGYYFAKPLAHTDAIAFINNLQLE